MTKRSEGVDTDSLRLYLREVSQYPLLSKEEEVGLAKAIEAGRAAAIEDYKDSVLTSEEMTELRTIEISATKARQVFVSSNLRLVVFIAKRYQSSGVPLLDLVQEGNLGLIHAVEKFDWRRWLQVLDIRHVVDSPSGVSRDREHGTNRSPASWSLRHARCNSARPGVSRSEASPAAHDCRAQHRGRSLRREIVEMLGYRSEPLSLSHPLLDDGAAELGDLVQDPTAMLPFDEAALSLLPHEIDRLLAPLTTREGEILRLRFGLDSGSPRTLEQVGDRLNVSRERIRQIEARALSKPTAPGARHRCPRPADQLTGCASSGCKTSCVENNTKKDRGVVSLMPKM